MLKRQRLCFNIVFIMLMIYCGLRLMHFNKFKKITHYHILQLIMHQNLLIPPGITFAFNFLGVMAQLEPSFLNLVI